MAARQILRDIHKEIVSNEQKNLCVSPATAISRPRFARIYTRRKACGSSVHYLSFKERLVFEQAPC